jgi:type I restriction enzyme S subunit
MLDLPDELPTGWVMTPLGELLVQQERKRAIVATEKYVRLGVRWYAEGPFMKDAVVGSDVKGRHLFRVRSNDFIYNRLFAWKGSFGVVPEEMDGCFVSNEFPVFTAHPAKATAEFIWRWFSLPAVWKAVENKSSGSTRTSRLRFKEEDLLKLAIPLPPLLEQQTITLVLRAVQRAAQATTKVIDAAHQLKQSLVHHLFTYGPMPFAEAERVLVKDTEIGTVPEYWQTVPLGEVVTETQYGLSQRGEAQGRYPILRMSNLAEGQVTTQDLQYVNLEDQEFKKFRLNRGNLLFNRTNSIELVGKTSLFGLEGDFVFASYLIRLALKTSRILPDFLNYYLNAAATQTRLKSLATQAVSQSNINATKLRGLTISLPPLGEQQRIASSLRAIDKKIAVEEKRRHSLEALEQTLLHNLMTGKVRVHPVQCQVAAEEAP